MKNKLKVLTLFFLVITTQSCSVDKPESYFGKTTLNVNKYIDFGSVDFSAYDRNAKPKRLIRQY